MSAGDRELHARRTWFGITARVAVGPGFVHRAGVGAWMIPHPPLANGLLRIGLPARLCRRLSIEHEFAHFQTAPLCVVYIAGLLGAVSWTGIPGPGEILFLLASIHAAWEFMAEGLTILKNAGNYYRWYRNVPRLPRAVFWSVAGGLSAAGWLVLLLAE